MVFGLSRDFIQQDGISMLLGKPDGLPAEELNMVQARMLMNSGIPYHVRLLLREIDLDVTLEYAVSRRRMLSHLLKSERLTMNDFFGLLLQIVQGMEEGRLYMLRPERYALHEDYIFVEGPLSSCKVYLTYIPLDSVPSESAAGANMRFLIMVLMASVTELSGNGIQRLLQYCGKEDFTPGGLKELLSELLTGGDGIRRSMGSGDSRMAAPLIQAAPPGTGTTVQDQDSPRLVPGPQAPPREPLHREILQNEIPWTRSYPKLRLRDEEAQKEQSSTADADEADSPSSAYRTYVMLGGVLADALLWKFLYLDRPTTLWLAVCAAVTLILAVLCLLIWTGKITTGRDGEEEEADMEAAIQEKRVKPRRELEWDFGKHAIQPVRPSAAQKTDQVPSAPAVPGFSNNREQRFPGENGQELRHTNQPLADAATTLLPREDTSGIERDGRQAARTAPYLERCQDDGSGAAEKIELNRPSFIIGRSPEVAQYVEPSEGASRVHAEISKSHVGYILKDLDSRNGTLYEGEAMVPYKEYPLTEGAVFTIVKGCYTFRSA
ncbi:DUF6382 domain-containing protein [Paenibacillus sp. PK3_47]|uniref:DUF6382 domain-containing protein n=1 Tax=Paenibacillus sp. PK3_47 TaxID=2072642 RepID=UPI00201DF7C6|nr:DUF6382 domain-containing protein [Paenibacillus sp. PK3_47]